MKLHLFVIRLQDASSASLPAGLCSLLVGWDVAIEHVDCVGPDPNQHGCMDSRVIDALSRHAASPRRPDIVVIETDLHHVFTGFRQTVNIVRAQWGDVPVILCGSAGHVDGKQTLAATGADAVYTGQDESSLLHLLGTFGFRLRRLRVSRA